MALLYTYFFFLFFFFFVCLFVCLRGKRGSCGRGSWGRGRRGYIVLCIHVHVNILTVMNRKTVVANGTKQ